MSNSQQQKLFQTLVQQLELPDDLCSTALFQTAKIQKVQVHTESQRWTFILEFAHILPIKDLQTLAR